MAGAKKKPIKSDIFDSQIHVFRAMKRMTQQELAEKVNCSRQTILKLERNEHAPSLLLAHDISLVFNVPIEQLFIFNDTAQKETEGTK